MQAQGNEMQEITLDELKAAIRLIKGGKSPRCDGLPVELFKLEGEVEL